MKKYKITIILFVCLISATCLVFLSFFNKTKNDKNSMDNIPSSVSSDLTASNSTEVEQSNNQSSSDNKDFDGSKPIIRKMNEPLAITAIPSRKQGEKPPTSSEVFASWIGEISVNVTNAKFYKDIAATGIPIKEFSGYQNSILDDPEHEFIPLVIDLEIENISAVNSFSLANPEIPEDQFDGMIFQISCQNEFSLDNFQVNDDSIAISSWLPMVYISTAPAVSTEDTYWSFDLKKGDTKKIEICALIEATGTLAPLDKLYLEICTSSKSHLFGIELNDIAKES